MRSFIWLHDNIRQHNNPTLEQALVQSQPQGLILFTNQQNWLLGSGEQPKWLEARRHALHALPLDLPIIEVNDAKSLRSVMDERQVEKIYCDITSDFQINELRQGFPCITNTHNMLLSIENMAPKYAGKFTKFYYGNKENIEFLLADKTPPTSPFKTRVPISEPEALGWLDTYLNHAIQTYDKTRNDLLGDHSFSRLSAALAIGSLSVTHLAASVNNLGQNKATQQYIYELVWREYFQRLASLLGAQLFTHPQPLTPAQQKNFDLWCQGNTGIDIVDAGIKELTTTGFVSNRVRQLMASGLVHNLQVPWQYGAAFFEQHLWDYHPAPNYGNWGYIAGYSPVSKKSHEFDLDWQTRRYDPNGTYRETYL
ncbi:FAD-binding domain-containing protein [Salinibius halmophilus]|uniref:FAD-binding domain-containing protein n=1 Tax=Salinibius halmophilus TaxID=1853216 RepID=UPI000E6647C8|nr:FAD-binding domain-containing protein [Salinibius halmophilus]